MFQEINDNLTDFGDLVSVELWSQLCDNVNHLLDAVPVGTITPILHGLAGVPVPDINIWQECDGTAITHPLSPIRNTLSPDYKTDGRYMRMFTNPGDIGNFDGANVKNLSHNHTGQTGFNADLATNADTDNDYWTALTHTHSISSDLGFYNFEPIHCKIKHYIKINETNSVYGTKFKDLEKDFSTSIAQALWIKQSNDINALDLCYPIGMLLFMVNSQSNLPSTPDLNFWQLCDGSTVSNVLSPVNGQVLPDLRNKFIRHPQSGDPIFDINGQATINLAHSHGGGVGFTSDRNDFQLDNGDERYGAENHNHTLGSGLGVIDTTPYYLELQIYTRIV